MPTGKKLEWPDCLACGGDGEDQDGKLGVCEHCSGTGRDPECCEKCDERAIGYDEDGNYLCEDHVFESVEKANEQEAI